MRADDGVPEIEHTLETNDGTSATDPRNLTTNYTYNALADLGQQVSADTGTTPKDLRGRQLATSTNAGTPDRSQARCSS